MRRETLEENIASLQAMLGELAESVAAAFRSATTALLDGRLRMAERVIEGDPAIDDLRARIEALATETITIFAPVGPDMRTVVAAIQSAHELERMGDLAQHVAEAARRRAPHSVVPAVAHELFTEFSGAAIAMVAKSAAVLRTRNVILALELEGDDDRVDALHAELFALMFGERWTCGIPAAVDLTLLARFYERIADHAVALAERTVFVVTGRHPEALQL
ncbi:phosphate signaling complex protein PhoU [Pseudonocardia pini]|uniref:phosphate signaling complex protein PhoU n=1 Tax=Pseudonocardia pini TaxID=2758030 RepID=UPI0015F109CC|nr:phosphate signaling complex protein PhoU [Pseudonocardia pini]